MRPLAVVLALAMPTTALACSLLVGTDDLAGGGAHPGGADASSSSTTDGDAATADGGVGAGADGGGTGADADSGSPPDIRLASPAVTSDFTSTGASTTATAEVVTGDLLVVAVAWTYMNLQSNPPAMAVSDSLGNSWQPATSIIDNYQVGPTSNCKADAQIFYAAHAAGGHDVVTVTSNQPGNTIFGFTLLAYAGAAANKPLDAFGGQTAPPAGSNQMSSPALAITEAKEIIVAVFTDTVGSGLMTPGTGFTRQGSNTSLYAMVEDGPAPQDHIATANLPSGATNNCWSVAAAAFR